MRGAALYGEVRNAAAQENPEYLKVRVIFDQFTFKYDLEVLDERPVLHVYTNKPLLTADALPYAVVPLRSDGAEQVVDVPTQPGATCVSAQCFALTQCDFGGVAWNFCGRADFPGLGKELQRKQLVARQDGGFAHGGCALAVAAGAVAAEDEAADRAARARLAERATRFYSGPGALQPLNGNLLALHIKYLDYLSSNVPAAFFMYWLPRWNDNERFVLGVLAAAAARLGWAPARARAILDAAAADAAAGGDAPADDTVRAAVLAAEALQLVPNAFPYETDVDDRNRRGRTRYESRRRPIEHFSAATRVTRCGDCEDLAREMVTLADCVVRRADWTTPAVRALRDVLRCYVVSLQLGCMRAPPREPGQADQYSTGTWDGLSCDAHAWVTMLSASTAAALARAGNAARPGEPPLRLADYMLTPWKRCGLPVLTMDGTAVKQVYPSAERGARSAAREYGGSGRVRLGGVPNALRRIDHDKLLTTIKVASPDNDGVYVFLLKALTLYGLEVGAPGSGLDARDVFFAQGDKYGASYADVFRAIPHKGYAYGGAGAEGTVFEVAAAKAAAPLSLRPSVVYTPEEVELALRTMGRNVPIPPAKAPPSFWTDAEAAAFDLPRATAAEAAAAAAAAAPLVGALRAAGARVLEWGAEPPGARCVARLVVSASDLSRADVLAALAGVVAQSGAAAAVRAEHVFDYEVHVALWVESV